MGWVGTYDQLKYTLRIYGCDFEGNDPLTAVRDERGVRKPSPAGGIFFFLGIKADNAEVVIDDSVVAFIGEKPAGTVAAYMHSTSYGVSATVICFHDD